MYQILHHGAVNGVTGSCHQLKLHDGTSFLVDCGLFQGAEVSAAGSQAQSSNDNPLLIEFPLEDVAGLVITHCHIDHVGRIPYLLAAGFDKPIYATEATAHLLPLVLEDAIKVGITRDTGIIAPVLRRIRELLVPVPYKQWQTLSSAPGSPTLRLKFHPAGHILGSAYVEFALPYASLNQGVAHKDTRVVFSGDLGAPYAPLLPAPKSLYRCDDLVLESTYGDKNHSNRASRREQLRQVIAEAFADRGTILIPAFSVGRTQELLYEIEEIIYQAGRKGGAGSPINWDYIDVIVDSPLASQFTRSYRQLKELWDAEAMRKVTAGRHPLSFEQLLTIDSHSEHLQTVEYLQNTGRPAIVIAASGMCSGGRILNYLKALIEDPRTDVLFVGYQAAGTPGRDIQTYGPKKGYVLLDGQKYTINADVFTLSGYSAHAGQQDLLNFVKRMRFKPSRIRLVHGDEPAKKVLQQKFREILPNTQTIIP